MELKRGTVVRTLAGHDKDRFMCVLGIEGERLLIADGKTRTVHSPKRKNVNHVALTAAVLEESCMESDKALREALKSFGEVKKSV